MTKPTKLSDMPKTTLNYGQVAFVAYAMTEAIQHLHIFKDMDLVILLSKARNMVTGDE